MEVLRNILLGTSTATSRIDSVSRARLADQVSPCNCSKATDKAVADERRLRSRATALAHDVRAVILVCVDVSYF